MVKLQIIEYIGPYGVGKTTQCNRDVRRLEREGKTVYVLADLYAFVDSATIGTRLWWVIRNAWTYVLIVLGLSYCVRSGSLPERYRRAHRTARKVVYVREFSRTRRGIFLNDEGLIHSVCQAMTGTKRRPTKWLLSLLYRGLSIRFVYGDTDRGECVERILRRNEASLQNNTYEEGSFLALINSSDESEVRFLVNQAGYFYDAINNILVDRWKVEKIDLTEQRSKHARCEIYFDT